MTQRALVVFATRNGSTKEIAEAVAQTLSANGVEATASDAASADDLSEFELVVIGSPIQGGMLHEEVLAFIECHHLELMDRTVAMFTVGMLPVSNALEAKGEHEGAIEQARLRAPGVKAISHAIFPGAYDPRKVGFVSRKLMEQKRAPIGDFRNWDLVRGWAAGLKERLAA